MAVILAMHVLLDRSSQIKIHRARTELPRICSSKSDPMLARRCQAGCRDRFAPKPIKWSGSPCILQHFPLPQSHIAEEQEVYSASAKWGRRIISRSGKEIAALLYLSVRHIGRRFKLSRLTDEPLQIRMSGGGMAAEEEDARTGGRRRQHLQLRKAKRVCRVVGP